MRGIAGVGLGGVFPPGGLLLVMLVVVGVVGRRRLVHGARLGPPLGVVAGSVDRLVLGLCVDDHRWGLDLSHLVFLVSREEEEEEEEEEECFLVTSSEPEYEGW